MPDGHIILLPGEENPGVDHDIGLGYLLIALITTALALLLRITSNKGLGDVAEDRRNQMSVLRGTLSLVRFETWSLL
jgi:hypothetical protein